jgi:hypothetical protein
MITKKVMADVNAPFVVEMDSVLGTKGGKVLMTLHFVKTEFMLAFLRDSNDSQSVIDVFDKLTELLGLDTFRKLFPILLADKGSEFTNTKAIEYYRVTGEVRTKVFYCDSYSAYQRASQEKNHGQIHSPRQKGIFRVQSYHKGIPLDFHALYVSNGTVVRRIGTEAFYGLQRKEDIGRRQQGSVMKIDVLCNDESPCHQVFIKIPF